MRIAGVHFEVYGDDFKFMERQAETFASVVESNDFFARMLERCGEFVVDTIMRQFETGGAFQDTPWDPLSESRQQARERAGLNPEGPILIGETERLVNSWGWEWLDENAIIVNMGDLEASYGGFNQLGSPETGLPERPMLVVDEYLLSGLDAIFKQSFDGQWVKFIGE